MVKVSAILPLYNGRKYIEESIESIIGQTFEDWELIVVSEYENHDGSAEIVEQYARSDARVRLLQNTEKLGLARSLNVGIAAAKGQYIARVDADDPSYPERFEQQVAFMDANSDVFLCGTLTRSMLPTDSYILEVPCEGEELKAAMLFGCEISHCSVMFRRREFLEKGYAYDPDMLAEDYDLWTKIMFREKIVNMPAVLVDHRWGFDNISLEKGDRLHRNVREISASVLQRNLGICVAEKDFPILASWRNQPREFARKNRSYFLMKTFDLLEQIEMKNEERKLIENGALRKILWKRWNWACETCGLNFKKFQYEELQHSEEIPVVSVILPVCHGAEFLREAVDSIIRQDFSAWELLIICEPEENDGSREIARFYEKHDKRIKVVVNETRLGLADSLNRGIELSRGKYIARIDADDISDRGRLSAQVHYMDRHPNVGVTQTYQQYFGKNAENFIHRPPVSAKEMKAKLLFFCDACHSTVMMRKAVLEQHGLRYDSSAQLEDYELWTKIVNMTDFETIPEIYGAYRVGSNNISLFKNQQIHQEMCRRTAMLLKENLGVEVAEKDIHLLGGWNNIFNQMAPAQKCDELKALQDILLKVWNANKKTKFYDRKALLSAICAKWRWAKFDEPWQGRKTVKSISSTLELYHDRSKKGWLFQTFVKKPCTFLQWVSWHINISNTSYLNGVIYDVSNAQTERIDKSIEHWTWERYSRLADKLASMEHQYAYLQNMVTKMQYESNRVPYIAGEKIRIVFLFQIASFYPSWETLYDSCMKDERTDTRLVFLDETNTEKSQMRTARAFLDNNNMEYEEYENFPLEEFRPHIIVIQTPYDEWHRKEEHWANRFRERGFRLVYIPYGIEISDTEDSHKLHFNTNVINNCWRIYTFSEIMQKDYRKYSVNSCAVRALGLPRFDYYFECRRGLLPDEAEARRKDRPVVLWKVHFPKVICEKGRDVTVTPALDEYEKFAQEIRKFNELFFILMPHPKFMEAHRNMEIQMKISSIIETVAASENAWIDTAEDYRNSLVNADYIIVDRSAVMVEAGALKAPVLYMTNPDYYEPVTEAIKPLIASYYQGTNCKDMCDFLELCLSGNDYLAMARQKAFAECIPFFDGKCGDRIKEDLINGIFSGED